MPKETSGLTVTIDMSSDNLSRKLKAIAKHAQALADELDEIDIVSRINETLNIDNLKQEIDLKGKVALPESRCQNCGMQHDWNKSRCSACGYKYYLD